MSENRLSRVDTPLDRLVVAVQAWDRIPPVPQRARRSRDNPISIERAEGAVRDNLDDWLDTPLIDDD